jgi:hypothetical protein
MLMHNMMVEVRIDREEQEDAGMYVLTEDQDGEEEEVEEALEKHLCKTFGFKARKDMVDYHVKKTIERWDSLYNTAAHVRLQTAVMNHISEQYVDYKTISI